MFGWFKKLFTGETVEAIVDAFEPQVSTAIKEEKVIEEKHPDFESMTKTEIVAYAQEKGLKIDRRKKKETMIAELINHLKKEN